MGQRAEKMQKFDGKKFGEFCRWLRLILEGRRQFCGRRTFWGIGSRHGQEPVYLEGNAERADYWTFSGEKNILKYFRFLRKLKLSQDEHRHSNLIFYCFCRPLIRYNKYE